MKIEKTRLLWQARRGMLELDLILKNFIEFQYDDLTAQLQVSFQDLLTCADQDLYNWLVKHEPVTQEQYNEIINVIRSEYKT